MTSIVIAAAGIVAWRAGYLGRPGPARTGGVPPLRSVAVLPLANLSGDPQQEYFADGMTEALTTSLARVRALKVISRTSAMQYKATQKSLPQIGRELGVDAVVEGSVQRVGNRVRITAKLFNAAADENLWGDTYDREVRDVLELHGEVAQAIAGQIQIALTPGERRQLMRQHKVDPVAHDAYLQGLFAYSRLTSADMERAIGYFEQAIARDPTFAEAHAGLASACLMRGLALAGGLTREAIRELLAKARVSAQHAIEADETVSGAHTVLAAIALMLDWDWPRAEERLRRALELDANASFAHTYRAMLFIVLERRDDARREVERATELDPMNVATRAEAGEFSFWLRDHNRAIAYAAQALAFDPAYPRAHFVLGRVYETQGRIVESIAEYEKAKWPAKWVQGARAAFQRGGRSGFDQWQLSGLLAQGPAVNPMYLARAYANLGRTNEAMAALERAYQEREPVMCLVKAVEWFDPLHSDPRFIDLARRMRLPE